MDPQTAFEILADTDRQHILKELLENDGVSDVGVLAEQLAVRRQNGAGETEQQRAKLELHHNHLPRLADHGVIDYDSRSGDVVLRDHTELTPYLSDTARRRTVPVDSRDRTDNQGIQ